jgi:hypothetical protein
MSKSERLIIGLALAPGLPLRPGDTSFRSSSMRGMRVTAQGRSHAEVRVGSRKNDRCEHVNQLPTMPALGLPVLKSPRLALGCGKAPGLHQSAGAFLIRGFVGTVPAVVFAKRCRDSRSSVAEDNKDARRNYPSATRPRNSRGPAETLARKEGAADVLRRI